MDDRDREDLAKREETKKQLNEVLGKHGWKFEIAVPIVPGALEYRLTRSDGHKLGVRVLLSDILMFNLDGALNDVLDAAGIKVNPALLFRLWVSIRAENKKVPMAEVTP